MSDLFGPPEESVDVYLATDGSFASDTPDSIDQLIAEGEFSHAYALMRSRVAKEAIRTLRLSGCTFAEADAHMASFRTVETIDSEQPAALYLGAAERFCAEQPKPAPDQFAAMTALRLLGWQRRTLKAAATDEEARALVQMALFSASIGFSAGTSGVGGVVPDMRKMRRDAAALAERERKRTNPLLAQNDLAVAGANEWRIPLAEFIDQYLTQGRYTAVHLGLKADVLTDFRRKRPEVKLPNTGADRYVGKRVDLWFEEQAG